MIDNINEVRLLGKIVSDVELKTSQKNNRWLCFSIETTINGYHRYNMVMAFGDIAENLSKNARKGKIISMIGSVGRTKNAKTNAYETNIALYSFKIVGDSVEEEKVDKAVEEEKPNPQSAKSEELPF